MKNKRLKMFIGILIILILLSLVGYFVLQYIEKQKVNDFVEYTPQEEISDEQFRQTIVSVYFKNKETNQIMPEARLIDVKTLISNPYYTLVKLLMEGPKNEKLQKLIPEGTNLNKVEIQGDMVVIDFSEEFVKNHIAGVEEKNLTIYSIVDTLTELMEVNSVKFLINGKNDIDFEETGVSLKEPFFRTE